MDDVVKGLILVGLFLTALFGLFHWGENSLQKARMPSLYPPGSQVSTSPRVYPGQVSSRVPATGANTGGSWQAGSSATSYQPYRTYGPSYYNQVRPPSQPVSDNSSSASAYMPGSMPYSGSYSNTNNYPAQDAYTQWAAQELARRRELESQLWRGYYARVQARRMNAAVGLGGTESEDHLANEEDYARTLSQVNRVRAGSY